MEKYFKSVRKENLESSRRDDTSKKLSEKRPRQELEVSDSDIVSDPGLRKQIKDYPLEKRDDVRRRYLAKGPSQPIGHEFPRTYFSGSMRRFNPEWYERFPWLEYSVSKDKAFCLYCYLFPDENSNKTGDHAFTVIGYDNWQHGKHNLAAHEGSLKSPHNRAKADVIQFSNQKQNIDVVLTKQKVDVQDDYRTRLTTVVRICRYLLGEGLSFRGNDESAESIRRGHFFELVSWVCEHNEEINKVMASNAPKNNQPTSSTIQREIIECCVKETRKLILNELGNKNFSLLLDEARDSSIKEQMAMVVRFMNDFGEITERFLGVFHVNETSAKGLKEAVDSLFAKNGLSISRL